MFIAYIIVTAIAAAANAFSATLDFIRYKQVLINMANERGGIVDNCAWHAQSSRGARTAGRHRRASDRDGRRSRSHPVLCRCHHYPPARTRLLVRSGDRVPLAGHGRAGIATCLVTDVIDCRSLINPISKECRKAGIRDRINKIDMIISWIHSRLSRVSLRYDCGCSVHLVIPISSIPDFLSDFSV